MTIQLKSPFLSIHETCAERRGERTELPNRLGGMELRVSADGSEFPRWGSGHVNITDERSPKGNMGHW